LGIGPIAGRDSLCLIRFSGQAGDVDRCSFFIPRGDGSGRFYEAASQVTHVSPRVRFAFEHISSERAQPFNQRRGARERVILGRVAKLILFSPTNSAM
jgi:hypothetical protein